MDVIGGIIERVDEKTGEQQCIYIRSKFEYLDDKQRSPLIENSKLLLCSGQLKSVRGTVSINQAIAYCIEIESFFNRKF